MDLCPFALKYATISSGKEQYKLNSRILLMSAGHLQQHGHSGFLRISVCNAEI